MSLTNRRHWRGTNKIKMASDYSGELVRLMPEAFQRLLEAGERYGAKALERLITESLVTVLYLIKSDPPEFDRYIRGGLGRFKEALELATSDARGVNHALTPAVRASVNYVIEAAG